MRRLKLDLMDSLLRNGRVLALVLATLAGLMTLADATRRACAGARAGPPRDGAWLRRYAGLAPHLPARGVVGFVYDAHRLATESGTVALFLDYLLAMRALAPLHVANGTGGAEFVVGEYAESKRVVRTPPGEGYELAVELDNGVVLWKRR